MIFLQIDSYSIVRGGFKIANEGNLLIDFLKRMIHIEESLQLNLFTLNNNFNKIYVSTRLTIQPEAVLVNSVMEIFTSNSLVPRI